MLKKTPHDQSDFLKIKNAQYQKIVLDFFKLELEKDGQDITSEFLLNSKKEVKLEAQIIAKEKGVLAGMDEIQLFLKKEKITNRTIFVDGEYFNKNDIILSLAGEAKKMLKIERIVLNFLSRLSGIATVTKRIAQKLPKDVFVAATRKTLWGLLDKKAVSIGGGLTHRLNLEYGILIKENHIKAISKITNKKSDALKIICQNIEQSLNRLKNKKYIFFEIEIESENEFQSAIKNFPQINRSGVIMFDDFKSEKIKQILKEVKQKKLLSNFKNVYFEASGGINEKNFLQYAKTGVDVISCGFLTKNPHSIDLSMKFL